MVLSGYKVNLFSHNEYPKLRKQQNIKSQKQYQKLNVNNKVSLLCRSRKVCMNETAKMS